MFTYGLGSNYFFPNGQLLDTIYWRICSFSFSHCSEMTLLNGSFPGLIPFNPYMANVSLASWVEYFSGSFTFLEIFFYLPNWSIITSSSSCFAIFYTWLSLFEFPLCHLRELQQSALCKGPPCPNLQAHSQTCVSWKSPVRGWLEARQVA